MQRKKITILGDGGWATALAILLSKKGLSVKIWGAFSDYVQVVKVSRKNDRFLPGFDIPKDIALTSDEKEALDGADAIIIAIPSQFLRSAINRFDKSGFKDKLVISVVKGIENETLNLPSEILKDVIGIQGIAVLSGPTIAREVASGLPASAVIASRFEDIARDAQEILMSERFRVYTSSDMVGVELGGSLKNVVAIAAGISDGLGLGTNAKSALFTRGIVEMKRLGMSLGARQETFNGLSGIGDLVTTCVSPYSRNRNIGEEIAKGRKLADILKDMNMVAEGIDTARSVYDISGKMDIDMPITEQVYKVLFQGKDALSAVNDLMTRSKKAE